MKKLISIICLCFIIVLVSGCGKEDVKSPQATKMVNHSLLFMVTLNVHIVKG